MKEGAKETQQEQEFTHENELVESSSTATATATATEEYCSEKEVWGGVGRTLFLCLGGTLKKKEQRKAKKIMKMK